MDTLTLAKRIADHLGVAPEDLPVHLFTDEKKRYPLTDQDDRLLGHYNEDTLWALKTVRFLKDFARYQAGSDLKTTNTSFVRTAELFRKMGLKNYYFHLQLNNPVLVGVDPWDKSLSDEIKFMIVHEANNNIWYIIRELIKVNDKRFIGSRAVISFIWCCLNHINTLILLPRQTGKQSWDESQVKVPGGWKRLGDIEVGDTILAPDATETKVVGVHPQGSKPVYRITFADGRVHEAGPEHLWKVFDHQKDEWEIIDTLNILDRYHQGVKLSIPCAKQEDGKPFGFTLAPYFMGCRLTEKKIKPHNPARLTRQDNFLKSYALLNKEPEGYFIPQVYRHAKNAFQRLNVLQGIFDHIGKVNSDGSAECVVYSAMLANNIQYMARSLEMLAEVEEVIVDIDTMDREFKIVIQSTDISQLFTGEKKPKAIKIRDSVKQWDGLVDIRSLMLVEERKSCTCIEVDHPDHLFVTDDFIVTHNTVGMQVMTFIMQYIIGRGYNTGLITLASNNRQQFVNAIKKIRSAVPPYLLSMSYKDKDSGNILTYQGHGPQYNNVFEIRVPNGGADGAENVARGSTFGALLIDEPAWIKFIENIISGSGPSTLREQKTMLEKGMPWFSAQATTPNSILKDEGRYMYEEYKSSTQWRENYFDCFSESHLFEKLIKQSRKKTTYPKVAIQYNHLQLGYGEDWVVKTMDRLKLPWDKAKIDLLMMWTEEGKNKIFDDKTRELLNKSKVPHLRHQEIEKTELFVDWFIDTDTLEKYVLSSDEFILIGCDTSDALGGDTDACTVTLRRGKTGEVIATGRYSLAFLGDVREVILFLLLNIPNSLLIIERNRAQQIIDDLLIILPSHDIDPFKRIYNEIYQNPLKHSVDYRDVQQTKMAARTKGFYLKYKSKFGFVTTGQSREILYGLIYEAVVNTGALSRYGELIDEFIGLQQNPGGRIDHTKKGHDDVVISWLLTYWFIKLGYNKALYGIPANSMLTNITTLAETKANERYTKEQINEYATIRARIGELTKRLLNCESELIAPRIEADIKKLSKQLPNELNKLITIDEVIENARSERTKRRLKNKRRNFLGYR